MNPGKIMDNLVFQQDGTSPHFALIVQGYLNEAFFRKLIDQWSPRNWVSGSPNLITRDFFARGFEKSKVYELKASNI